MGALRTAFRVMRDEGPAAARDRFLDRLAERRRRARFPLASPARGGLSAPLVNVMATPPGPWLGGLQTQLLRRLDVEAEERAVALLHPTPLGYRLEWRQGARRAAVEIPAPALAAPPALEDAAFEAAVRRAAEITGATAVHVEGLAGMPLASLVALAEGGLRVIVALHDLAFSCAHLRFLAPPPAETCGVRADVGRCEACVARGAPVDFAARHRTLAAELVKAAVAVIVPSRFLGDRLAEATGGIAPARVRVIEPGADAFAAPPPAASDAGPVRHVALVGGVQSHKGASVFAEVVEGFAASGVRWSAFGGGDVELLRRLRRAGVFVRGYHRSGALPLLLREHRVDLALLLSTWPEAYSLTLDECLAIGVPVIAFDHGAVAERVRRLGGGVLVPLEEGARGVGEAVAEIVDGRRPRPSVPAPGALPRIRDAARAHLDLDAELGLR